MPSLRGILKIWQQARTRPQPWVYFCRVCIDRLGLAERTTFRYEGARFRPFPSRLSRGIWLYPDKYHGTRDIRFLRKLLQPGDTFVDVGANIGTHAVCLALWVGKQGKVVAIEAHPQVYQWLSENIRLNGLKNIQTFHCAVGAESGTVCMESKAHDDENTVVPHSSSQAVVEVPLKTLDELPLPQTITVLKIDVEGYEKFVLAGARKTLERTHSLYIEISEENFEHFGYGTPELTQMLCELGLTVYRFADEHQLVRMETDYRTPYRFENIVAVSNPQWLQARLQGKVTIMG